jgi:hypothetical protein
LRRPDQTRPDQTRPDQTRPEETKRDELGRMMRVDMIGYNMIPKLAAEKKRGEEKRRERKQAHSERSVDQIWDRIVLKVEMEGRFRIFIFLFFDFVLKSSNYLQHVVSIHNFPRR